MTYGGGKILAGDRDRDSLEALQRMQAAQERVREARERMKPLVKAARIAEREYLEYCAVDREADQ